MVAREGARGVEKTEDDAAELKNRGGLSTLRENTGGEN